jgi:putative ABC transport system permease protein
MIVRESFILIGIGELIGIGGALALTRVLASFLFGISAFDIVTFAGVTLVVALFALAACALAGRRALRIDPVAALR